jgi:uncharacterized repeat protein (TIGR01451 family)
MRLLRASLAATLLVIGLVPSIAMAAGTTMSTPYPSVVADPGTTVKFPITVQPDTPERVDLTVTSQPDGWDTRLQGGGSTIAAVTTINASGNTGAESPAPVSGNFAQFTAEVSVPAEAASGNQQVVLSGTGADGSTGQITLDINVQTGEVGSVSLTTDFPSLTGPTSTTFKFSLKLSNDTNQQITFGLETDAPAGWTVTAAPATEANATTAVVDAGSTQSISVSAKAPADESAGAYKVVVRAVGGPQPVEKELAVNVTGTFDMSMSTSDQRLNATVTAGGTSTVTLVVTNSGTADIAGVKLSATPPRDWKVTFSPETVDIPANQDANVTATITASNSALAGDYVIAMSARSADNNASDSVSIRTTVETSPIGYIIGIAVLVIVGIGLFFVFQRYGRR